MKKILFVDDELNILQSLKRSYYKNRGEWEMTFKTSAEDALEYLKDNQADIVVSDMKMPKMNGIQFFKVLQKEHPVTIRIALSGHAEQTLLLESIGLFHQYYTKPCDLAVLEQGIWDAFELYKILKNPETRKMINGSKNLPVIPVIYRELQRKLSDPEASISDISEIIEKDISLTANILSLINTPFFGLRSSINDLSQAISLLGVELIKSMILTINIFQKSCSNIQDFSLIKLMNHSMRVANFCQVIAKHEGIKSKSLDLYFITGVLHDIGKVIFYNNYESEYKNVISTINEKLNTLKKAEESHFEITHAHIGAYLLGLWGFDKEIVNALVNHHGLLPDSKNISLLVQVLYSANLIDHRLVIIKENHFIREPDDDILKELLIEEKYHEWEEVIKEYLEQHND